MDMRDLYRDIIVDHNRSPRNFGQLEAADRKSEGFNPLCGDQLTVYLKLDGERIAEAKFEGQGCAISVASASLMTEQLKGMSQADARELFAEVHTMLTDEEEMADTTGLGKLAALAGVRAYPSRVKCASLCWHTLIAALDQQPAPASTE